MGIPELRADIAECEREIIRITADIVRMKIAKANCESYSDHFQEQKETAESFDMTVGDTWKEELCIVAQNKQSVIVNEIDSAKSTCDNAADELQVCIDTAYAKIEQLKKQIEDDIAKIRAIEAEEEARRKKNPECYRS